MLLMKRVERPAEKTDLHRDSIPFFPIKIKQMGYTYRYEEIGRYSFVFTWQRISIPVRLFTHQKFRPIPLHRIPSSYLFSNDLFAFLSEKKK